MTMMSKSRTAMVTPRVTIYSSWVTFIEKSLRSSTKRPRALPPLELQAIHGPGRPMTDNVMTTPQRRNTPLCHHCVRSSTRFPSEPPGIVTETQLPGVFGDLQPVLEHY